MLDVDGFDLVEVTPTEGVTLTARDATHDIEMVREIWGDRYYDIGAGWEVKPGDTVLDLGGGIGAFAVYAVEQGAAAVWTYEPVESSYALLERNTRSRPPVHATRAAVVADDVPTVRMDAAFALMDTTLNVPNTGLPRVSPDGDTEVPAVSLVDVLALAERWDYVKIDIEGGEYPLFDVVSDEDLDRIGLITMEFHHDNESTTRQRGLDLGASLMARGFGVVEVGWAFGTQGRLRARRTP